MMSATVLHTYKSYESVTLDAIIFIDYESI